MRDFLQFATDFNQRGLSFVLVDLDAAHTFMNVADNSGIIETKERNYYNARKAHDSIVDLLLKLVPNTKQKEEIDLKLGTLKQRLLAVGQTF